MHKTLYWIYMIAFFLGCIAILVAGVVHDTGVAVITLAVVVLFFLFTIAVNTTEEGVDNEQQVDEG